MYLKEPKNIQLRTFLFHLHFQPFSLQGTIATFFSYPYRKLNTYTGFIQYIHLIHTHLVHLIT